MELDKLIDQLKSNTNNFLYYKKKHDSKEQIFNITGIKDKFYDFEFNGKDPKFTREKLSDFELEKLLEKFSDIYSRTKPIEIKLNRFNEKIYHHIYKKKYDLLKQEFFNDVFQQEENEVSNAFSLMQQFHFGGQTNENFIKNFFVDNKMSLENKIKMLCDNEIIITKLELDTLYAKYKNIKIQFHLNYQNNSIIPKEVIIENNKYNFQDKDIVDYPKFFTFLNSNSYDEYVNNNYAHLKKLITRIKNLEKIEILECDFDNKIYQNPEFDIIIKYRDCEIKLSYNNDEIKLNDNNKYYTSDTYNNIILKYKSENDLESLINSINIYTDYKKGIIYNPETLRNKCLNDNQHSWIHDGRFIIINKKDGDFDNIIELSQSFSNNVYLYGTDLEENINFPLDLIKINFSKQENNYFLNVTMKTLIIRKHDIDEILKLNEEDEYNDFNIITNEVRISGTLEEIENLTMMIINLSKIPVNEESR